MTRTVICKPTGRPLSACLIVRIPRFGSNPYQQAFSTSQVFCAALAACVWALFTNQTPYTVMSSAAQSQRL